MIIVEHVRQMRKILRERHLWDDMNDLLDDHPFEVGLSFALVLFGIRSLASGLSAAPGSVQELPLWLAVLYCSLAIIGGASVPLGIMGRVVITWAHGLERFGLFISASAWGAYIVGLLFTPITAKSTLLVLALFALVFGCIRRARKINKDDKAQLNALRQEKEFRGGNLE